MLCLCTEIGVVVGGACEEVHGVYDPVLGSPGMRRILCRTCPRQPPLFQSCWLQNKGHVDLRHSQVYALLPHPAHSYPEDRIIHAVHLLTCTTDDDPNFRAEAQHQATADLHGVFAKWHSGDVTPTMAEPPPRLIMQNVAPPRVPAIQRQSKPTQPSVPLAPAPTHCCSPRILAVPQRPESVFPPEATSSDPTHRVGPISRSLTVCAPPPSYKRPPPHHRRRPCLSPLTHNHALTWRTRSLQR